MLAFLLYICITMIETLQEHQIQLGAWILRNDLVSSAWLEDKLHCEEKVESFKASWHQETDKQKFKIIL